VLIARLTQNHCIIEEREMGAEQLTIITHTLYLLMWRFGDTHLNHQSAEGLDHAGQQHLGCTIFVGLSKNGNNSRK